MAQSPGANPAANATAPLPPGSVFEGSLDDTYGAYLLGTFMSLILFGISIHQCYRYCRLYPTDTLYIRSLVGGLMILETLQMTLLMFTCYYYLVSNYFNVAVFNNGVWSLKIIPGFIGLITLTAQTFFARRAWLLGSKYRVVVSIAIFCLFLHVGFAIGVVIVSFQIHSLDKIGPSNRWLFGVALFPASLADVLLAGVIIIALRRSHQSYKQVDTWFDAFILYVVNTGLLTGIFNLIPSILAANNSKNFIWASFSFIAARLYANTLLSVKLLVSRGMEVFGTDPLRRNIIARANHLAAVEQWNTPQIPDSTPAVISIKVTAETEGDLPGSHSLHKVDSDAFARSV
ncbi:hypothetical protein OH77DRAFT_1522309 [Trametes cingulata]|nr:hypothetical protein OH77DRAFT_1522309 [Trametes cingulata]